MDRSVGVLRVDSYKRETAPAASQSTRANPEKGEAPASDYIIQRG